MSGDAAEAGVVQEAVDLGLGCSQPAMDGETLETFEWPNGR